ncbi:MAG TPA: ABC transporter substrate-binding protein [Ktedonobacterales bacterium]|nr:ABC transporter substrate-binding protein [Ktedonobacterales bacterium]
MRSHFARRARRPIIALLLALVSVSTLAACGSATGKVGTTQAQGCSSASGASGASGADAYTNATINLPTASGSLHKLTVGLTYIPNIQFAPFYVAEALGYYRQAGLDVTLRHHGFSEGEFDALVAGHEDAIIASGDEALQARSRGIPITYVAQMYTRYPVALIVPSGSKAQTVKDLRGKTIGVPGYYGATYIGLLALLQCAGMTKTDVNIQAIGYTQVSALLGHKVDAVMGYVNNEVLQFQKAGFAVRTMPVQQPFISNGLAALDSELSAHPDDIRAFVAATLKGVQYTIANPQQAVNLSATFVPGLSDPQKAADALSVLQATIPLFETSGRIGYDDPAGWSLMDGFMQAQGQLTKAVPATQAYSNSYLPG